MHKYIKWSIYIFLGLLSLAILYYREEVIYGLRQGKGQLTIIWNAKPVSQVLEDPSFPDSLKSKIVLIQEIRKFAFDSLGIKENENYTTFYDQQGKPILWTVTASEPYQLKAKEWKFPFLGTFSYKGFFTYNKAEEEEALLKKEGWDTSIDEVSGWSTLGWFKDPILSSMLKRSSGNLSNLIIHELTHGTLYVKDNVQFNENLASFVGDKGAQKFLEYKYGVNAKELKNYNNRKIFRDSLDKKVLTSALRLDSLYKLISTLQLADKESAKQKLLNEIKLDLKAFALRQGYNEQSEFVKNINTINNTFFLDYRRYSQDLSVFENEFKNKFQADLKAYILYLKDKYPSL